jgi:intracellular septation protein A
VPLPEAPEDLDKEKTPYCVLIFFLCWTIFFVLGIFYDLSIRLTADDSCWENFKAAGCELSYLSGNCIYLARCLDPKLHG